MNGRRVHAGNVARCALLCGAALAAAAAGWEPAAPGAGILDLQPARRSASVALAAADGRRGTVTLTEPNPAVNAWWLWSVQAPGAPAASHFHLENADPARQQAALDTAQPGRLLLRRDDAAHACTLWPGDALERARRSRLPFAPLCDGRMWLRNPVEGRRTTLEAATGFLRDHVWRGEEIVGFVRRELFRDAFVERGASAPAAAAAAQAPGAPPDARLDAAPSTLVAPGLGIDVGVREGLRPGRWYAAAARPGVFVSVAPPGLFAGASGRPRPLDAVEAQALAYLVAFDLARFDLGFALGTEHPRLGWSPRVRDEQRDARLAGPDGVGSAAPLVRSGMPSPALQGRITATFTGGFKREHGAFRHGALAAFHRGSHYGFVEQGVVFSRVVPGLSTLYVLVDGSVGMTTWGRDDDRLLPRLRHARQNGVALVEPDRGGTPAAGALVDQWGAGNWSGSADEKLRSLRAGACLVDDGGRRFLVYGWFSTATPRAMAQLFLGYRCRYAMHLDMNALEHTYLALYARRGARIVVEHLVRGMAEVDRSVGGELVPRFLGVADERDFFYLVAREEGR